MMKKPTKAVHYAEFRPSCGCGDSYCGECAAREGSYTSLCGIYNPASQSQLTASVTCVKCVKHEKFKELLRRQETKALRPATAVSAKELQDIINELKTQSAKERSETSKKIAKWVKGATAAGMFGSETYWIRKKLSEIFESGAWDTYLKDDEG